MSTGAISRSDVPPLSSNKTSTARSGAYSLSLDVLNFISRLSVDPSIRKTHRPITKHRSESGFYTKSANYVFSQRITIFNTKSITINCLKITDQIPTLQNAQIEVKLVNPALTLPSGISSSLNLNHIIDMEESTHDAGAACFARVRGAMNRQTARWKHSGRTGS
jgi:hypothetical protein